MKKLPLLRRRCAPVRRARFLSVEQLEDRSLLASVGYQLHVLTPGGPVTGPDLASVNIGDSFDVAVTAQDLRSPAPSPAGVYAAYFDVGYDSSKAAIAQNGLVYGSLYQYGKSGTAATNLVDELGAFFSGDPFAGAGTGAVEVVRMKMTATNAGTLTFTTDVSNMLSPAHDTLLFGTNQKISPSDINAGSAKSITIAAAAPIAAVADTASLMEDSDATPIDVLANDVTVPATGQAKNVVAVTQATHGTVTFSATGVSYKPAAGFAGADSFTYTAQNITAGPNSATSTATVNVTVIAPIVAANDSVSLAAGTISTAIDVLANDTTNPAGQAKSIVSLTQPGHGTAAIVNNQVVYMPTPGYSGNDSFTYSARNTAAGATSSTSTASVAITITAAGTAILHYQIRVVPVGGALYMPDPQDPHALIPTPDLASIGLGGQYDLVVTVGSTDLTSYGGVFAGYLDVGYDSSKTRVAAADANGNISDADFLAAFAPHSVQEITTIPGNSNYYPYGHSAGNQPNLIDDLGAFSDRSQSDFPNQLTAAETAAGILVAPPRELVRATFKAVANGSVTFSPDLSSISHPAHDSLMYGTDGPLSLDKIDLGTPRTITIADPYQAVADAATIAEDANATAIDVLANDIAGSGGAKQILSVTQPASGTVVLSQAGLTYQPAANFSGTDKFTYTANSNSSSTGAATATVTVTVTAVNDAPTLDSIADPDAILEDAGQQTINLSGISAGGGETQVLSVSATSSNPALTGAIAVNYASPSATGSLTYTPAANVSGTATITVTVKDDGGATGGGVDTVTRTFTISVTAVNDAPSFLKGGNVAAQDEDGATTIAWATAIFPGPVDEGGQTLTFEVTNDNHSLFTTQPAIDASGHLTYTPALNAVGTAVVTVVLHDDGGTEHGGVNVAASQTFTIDVTKTHPAQNAAISEDASGDGIIAPNDALGPINYINKFGSGKLADLPVPEEDMKYIDVSGDGFIAPNDPLIVINYINDHPFAPPVGEGEATGQTVSAADELSSLIAQLAADAAEEARRRRA